MREERRQTNKQPLNAQFTAQAESLVQAFLDEKHLKLVTLPRTPLEVFIT